MEENKFESGEMTYALMGIQSQAVYSEQEISNYIGNPLIEALPAIKTMNDVAKNLLNVPSFSKSMKDKPPEIKLHYVEQIRDYMQPLLAHLEMESNVSLMIRRGYVGRNPLSPLYARQFAVGIKEIMGSNLDENGNNAIGNRSTATNYTVLGISGIGKTTAIEKILLMYPQTIVHTDYKKDDLSLGYLIQIVWIKLECPFNGRRKAFCQNFFRVIDQILQTNYYNKFAKPRSSEEDLIDSMAHVCALHCVGVLVIDEIQRMKPGEKGQEMLDFFVELSNKLGIPMIYIGTYKATPIFDKLLANGRRAEGMGAIFLDPLEKGREWELFLSKLWEFQFTDNHVPLTKELSDLFYDLTIGITDYIVKLFIKSQQYAIAFGHKELSVPLIKKVAKNNMRFAEHIIQAIRSGDQEAIRKYDDIKPQWTTLNDYVKELGKNISLYGQQKTEHERAINKNNEDVHLEQLIELAQSLGESKPNAVKLASKIVKESNGMENFLEMRKKLAIEILNVDGQNRSDRPKPNQVKKKMDKLDMRFIAKEAKRKGTPVEDALKGAGLIKSFNEFLI